MKITFPAPDPRVLYYTRVREDETIEHSTVESIKIDKDGFWRATLHVCGMTPYTITTHQSPLAGWKAVYAVTDEAALQVIEQIAQRVVAIMQEKGASPSEIVELGMRTVEAGTIEDSIAVSMAVEEKKPEIKPFMCGACKKSFVYEKALKTHIKKAHPKKAMA